jgi:hypothetical protein
MKTSNWKRMFVLCLAGFLSTVMVGVHKTWAADDPTEIRFIVNHADCSSGMSSTFEFFVNGVSVGVYSSTKDCICNSDPLVVILNDPGTLSLIRRVGCTPVSMTLNDPNLELALGYVRVEIDRSESGTEIFCLVDYLNGGNCGNRDLCDGFAWPGTSSYSNLTDCPDVMMITPTDGLSSSGFEGGPFSPSEKVYTLTNTDSNSFDWTSEATAAWLTISPAAGSLAAGESINVEVSLNADANSLTQGIYNEEVIFTNSTSGISQTRGAKLTVNLPPPPPPQPTNPDPCDGATNVPVDKVLTWNNSVTKATVRQNVEPGVRPGLETYAVKEIKIPKVTLVDAIGQGGPDPCGYTFIDSDEPDGPSFDWIEISGTGTNLNLTDDSYYFPINLPFSFNFYDTDYTQVAVGSNGTIYFENLYMTLANVCIPGSNDSGIQQFIALYWDDLYPSGADNVYYQIIGSAPNRILVVQWQNVLHYGSSSDRVTAQAQLHENGDILLLYANPSSEAGSGATVGIQGDPNIGLGYLCNQASLHSNLAILFTFGGGVTYDVYFDTVNPPVNLIHTDLRSKHCQPVPYPLAYETAYYWQVIATNPVGQTAGPVWSFTTKGPPGEIEVTDSIPPLDDMNMPFGDTYIGSSRTETLTITNNDPHNTLLVTDISLGGSSHSSGTSDLSINLPAVSEIPISSGQSYLSAGWVSPKQAALEVVVKKGYKMLSGSGADVLLLASGSGVSVMQAGLAAFADINKVDFFDCSNSVPTLSYLNTYDVVVLMSNTSFANAVATGDVLADYVDNGGKVVESVASFATQGGWELAGRFVTGDYDSFVHGPAEYFAHSLGNFDNTHPVMDGVSTLTCDLPAGVGLKPDAHWVASWNNSTPLAATRNDNVVGINVFAYDGGFTGDAVLLFHNALVWLVEGGSAERFSLTNVPLLPAAVPPLGHIDISVIFEPNEVKEYQCNVSIQSNDTDEPEVTVHLSGTGIPDYLDVSPTGLRSFSGHPGGPFVPSKITYTLHNNSSSQTVNWSVSKTADWLDVSPLAGSIAPGAYVSVTAKTNSIARTLPQGDYNDVLLFTNLTTTAQHCRDITLNVFTAPKMWIDPFEGGFNVTVRQGETLAELLTIGNSGDANLSFNLSCRELPPAPLTVASPVAVVSSEDNEMVFEYSFSEPLSEKTNNFDLLKINGLELLERAGAPIVPVRPVQILVPYGREVVNCDVAVDGLKQLSGSFILQPAQKPYPLGYRGPVEMTLPDEKIYKSSSLWPGMYFEEIGTQSKRGYQVLILNLLPLQYVPTTGEVYYASKLVLTITLADSKQKAKVLSSGSAKAKIAASVDNPIALKSYSSADNLQKTDVSPLLPPGGPFQYVVITSQALKDAPGPNNFQAICSARTAQGLPATIVTTEWIYANYDGTKPSGGSDNQTRIRNFLIDAYQNWGTQYVLLGGTNAIVPARMFYVTNPETTTMPVDMYYGCVDPPTCTFDNDADGLYGEPTDGPGGGEVDLYGEIYVGRAAVENAAELSNFVNKTLTYNTTEGEYLHRIAMVGEYLGFGGVSDYATDSMEQIRTGGTFDGYTTCGFEDCNQPDFIDFNTEGCMPDDPTCCWPLYDAPGYDWPASQLTCLMNGGIHIINHLGHANETYCMKLYAFDLPALSNTDYFFVYSQGCLPGAFDTSNCFAEVLTTISHGAFGAVMNARYGWGTPYSTDGPSHRFARQFWDAPLGEGILEIGRANQDSKEDNIWDIGGSCIRWCLYELNLFGDPAQKFRFTEGVDGIGWMTVSPLSGVVVPSGDMDVNVVFSAIDLELGDHCAQIEIVSNDAYNPTLILPVTMTVVPSAFTVSPQEGLTSVGVMGGPFGPDSKIYTLVNDSNGPRDWQALAEAPWITIEPNQGILGPGLSQNVEVRFNPNTAVLEPGDYEAIVTFTDLSIGLDFSRDVTLNVMVPDFFTELFDAGDNDVNHLTLTLVPDDSGHFYTPCIEQASAFPVDPAGGIGLPLGDDDYAEIAVGGGKLLPFYRQYFDVFYVGSNGYISFDTGDINPIESFEQHFLYMRISALFDDLNPATGGTVSWKQTEDEVVVTYSNVHEYNLSSTNSFQIEMFFNGTIRITWLGIAAKDGLVGLSPGEGLADYFVESDVSQYFSCLSGDYNRDGVVDLADLAFFAGYWLQNDCSLVNGYCEGCDWNRSGLINFEDFSSFGKVWCDAP